MAGHHGGNGEEGGLALEVASYCAYAQNAAVVLAMGSSPPENGSFLQGSAESIVTVSPDCGYQAPYRTSLLDDAPPPHIHYKSG